MDSADFSQFVITTANETACETSTLKVLALSPHLPATFTGTSGNFWTSSSFADLSAFPSLICDSCPSGQGFASDFLQIPPHDGHPCCSAMYFVIAYVYSGLSPVRARPWRAKKAYAEATQDFGVCLFFLLSIYRAKCLFIMFIMIISFLIISHSYSQKLCFSYSLLFICTSVRIFCKPRNRQPACFRYRMSPRREVCRPFPRVHCALLPGSSASSKE